MTLMTSQATHMQSSIHAAFTVELVAGSESILRTRRVRRARVGMFATGLGVYRINSFRYLHRLGVG